MFHFITSCSKKIDQLWAQKRWLILILVSLVIIFWNAPYVYTGSKIGFRPGDSDYFFQAYEAIRVSIVNYFQFPWWNPWVSGGVPLYANPQIGVFSIQTLLVIIFGTVVGLKLSIVVYSLVGYWGMFLLLRKQVKADVLISLLLSFCWIANGFFVAHLFNHYTFVYFLLIPLALYLQLNLLRRRYWLYYGVFLGLLTLASFHYAVMQSAVILGVTLFYQIIHIVLTNRKSDIIILVRRIILAGTIAVVITGHRMYHTMTYVADFSKSYPGEATNPFMLLIKGLLTPGTNANIINGRYLEGNLYGGGEYAAYIGWGIAISLAIIAGYGIHDAYKQLKLRKYIKISRGALSLTALFVAMFVILLMAKGNWDKLSPLGILQEVPGYANLRVPSRWLVWIGLVGLISIALFTKLKNVSLKIKNIVLFFTIVATIELFLLGLWYVAPQFTRDASEQRQEKTQFVQYEDYSPGVEKPHTLYSSNQQPRGADTINYSYESTRNNIGELYGYEPLIDTLFDTKGRCGINKGCGLIDSGNAEIIYWSPNKIVITRKTNKAPVTINVAPSSYWNLNGKKIFPNAPTADKGQLVLYSQEKYLELTIDP